MDALDIRIIRAMGVQPYGRQARPLSRLQPAELARRLRVTPARVRERLKRMEAAGVIAGYELYPNLRHVGHEVSCYYHEFGDDDAADAALSKVALMEGTAGCATFVGGSMCVMVAYRTAADLQRKLGLLVELAGGGEVRKFFDWDMPQVTRPLSNLDWRILQALRGAARRPLPAVAEAIGVSARTVKRRVDRMAGEGSFFVVPDFDPAGAEGSILFYLVLSFDPDAKATLKGSLHRRFTEELVATDALTDLSIGNYVLFLAARSMAHVEELRRRGAAVAGVTRAQPFLFRGGAGSETWIDEAIAERIAKTRGDAPATRASAA